MRKRIVLTIVIVAIAAAAGLFYARAQERGWRNWHNGEGWGWRAWHNRDIGQLSERIVAHLARHLDLTQEQQAQINQIISAERPAIEPLVAQLAQASEQLRAAGADGQFDEARVRQFATQQAQAIAELIVAKERIKSKVFAVLTPEQRVRANEMLERFGPGSHFGVGRGPGRAG